MQITIFKNAWDSKNPHHVDVFNVLNAIKSGKYSKKVVEQMRTETDKKKRTELKKELPLICFSGSFDHRANDGITEHSGLIAIDFDHLGDRLESFRNTIELDRYTFSCFTSPSGDGLKVIVKIPANIENHKKYFEALKLYYAEKCMDDDCEVSRGCFAGYDPLLFINKESEVFTLMIEPKVDSPFHRPAEDQILADKDEIYGRIKKWVEKRQTYEDGRKYNFIFDFASAGNRFGLPMEYVSERMTTDYQVRASFVEAQDFVDITKKAYITYANQNNTSWFTNSGEINDFNPTGPCRDVITVNDIRSQLIHSYLHGESRGTTTYFKTLDPHWTWKKGEVTLMQGIPNHGKTTMMLQLMLIKSVKEGAKWGVFSPEQNPPIDFYKDLVHTLIGKSTEKYHKNYMSSQEFEQGLAFIHEHFFFTYPKDEAPTPEYINDRFQEQIIKEGICGCLIDPYNTLDNDYGKKGRDDIYISTFLDKETRFALSNDIYKLIIAHPSKMFRNDKEKDFSVPTFYNLAGGAMWPNKVNNILATHRPYFISENHNPAVQFHSQKIKKQKYVGVPGMVDLKFDIFTNRYIEFAKQIINDDGSSQWVGISPFDEDYDQKYELLSSEWSSAKHTQDSLTGMQGLNDANVVTSQLSKKRIVAKIDIPIQRPDDYNSDDDTAI